MPRRRLALTLALTLLAGAGAAAGRAPSPEVETEERVPVPEPSPLAVQYNRTGDALWVIARTWDLAVPLVLLVSGASARLRDLAARLGRNWFLTAGLYVVFFLLIVSLANLPLRYYSGYVRPHAYGLSRQPFAKWRDDALKALAVELVVGFCLGWVPFRVIARWPRHWWLVGGLLWVPFLAFAVLVEPVVIDPLYNSYGPMKDKALEARVLELARRAGVRGGRVFEVNKSVDTSTLNAQVNGLFGSKRIVLWDTLLNRLDDDEVLAVTGHELGHYVLNHVAWGVVLSSTILMAGLFWTDRAGRWLLARFARRFGFDSLADVAATPLLVVLIAASYAVLGPVALAYSRQTEHQADRFALDLTHRNGPAARAFAEIQRENLSVPRHSLFHRIWRSSHPDIADRIEFCNTYRPWAGRPTSAVRP